MVVEIVMYVACIIYFYTELKLTVWTSKGLTTTENMK